MSKGIKRAIVSLALLGLSVFLCASPAVAQLTTSESVLPTDDLRPEPVGEVRAEFAEDGRSITVSWDLSSDDEVRYYPTSSDFTTGGTFKETNDVLGYNIWRRLADPEAQVAWLSTVDAGVSEFVDTTIDVSEGSKRYIYMVSVYDNPVDAPIGGNDPIEGDDIVRIESAEVKNMWHPSDFDYDGDVDLDDHVIFERYFGEKNIAADINNDGELNLKDFFRWADSLGLSLYIDKD